MSAIIPIAIALIFAHLGTRGPPVFVAYVKSTCVHCQNMKPEWQRLMQMARSVPLSVRTIDCGASPSACRNISSYPTLRLYRNDKVFDYRGPRTAEEMLKWALSTV